MLVFGGLHKLKQELNDMHVFDFEKELWVFLYKNHQSIKEQLALIGSESMLESFTSDENRVRTKNMPFL
jgi:hypothetical protein